MNNEARKMYEFANNWAGLLVTITERTQDGGRREFVVTCEAHGHEKIIQSPHLGPAIFYMKHPEYFCVHCKELAKKSGVKIRDG